MNSLEEPGELLICHHLAYNPWGSRIKNCTLGRQDLTKFTYRLLYVV